MKVNETLSTLLLFLVLLLSASCLPNDHIDEVSITELREVFKDDFDSIRKFCRNFPHYHTGKSSYEDDGLLSGVENLIRRDEWLSIKIDSYSRESGYQWLSEEAEDIFKYNFEMYAEPKLSVSVFNTGTAVHEDGNVTNVLEYSEVMKDFDGSIRGFTVLFDRESLLEKQKGK